MFHAGKLKFACRKVLATAAVMVSMGVLAGAHATDEHGITRAGQLITPEKTLDYTTTAGRLAIRDKAGNIMAKMSYIAYTLDDAQAPTRPVTFFWDGGPGGGTFGENFLGFGPQRYFSSKHDTTGAPYLAEANPYSLLPQSDLVFIDPVGTGYSRAQGEYSDAYFWGVENDADAMTAAITRYLQIHQRWQSPKFIFGSSYGTSRASVLAHRLQANGIMLNGVMLFGSALNFALHANGMDHQFMLTFPTLAAIAWHHNKTAYNELPLPEFIERVNQFVGEEYGPALFQGNQITPEEKQQMAETMADFLGLSTDYIYDAHLRVSAVRFRKALLRDQGLTVGRMDGRATMADFDAVGEEPEDDYQFMRSFILPARVLVEDFYTREMGLNTHENYLLNAEGAIQAWDWKLDLPYIAGISDREHTERNIFPQNTWPAGLLASAMRTNTGLEVFQAHGYYDTATPFAWGNYDLAHMTHNPQLSERITLKYYETGHVIYADDDALPDIHADLADFYQRALQSKESGQP